MAQLELQGLYKQFGDVTALRSLDLTVESGEFVSFLGPSGCGKTTALRIVAGFEHADAGRILVDGVDLTGVPANRRDMGMVFQAYSLFPNMTAQANVEFGLRVRGLAGHERARRATDLLEMVGLGAARLRYPHQLSGGQQQRVALARALAIRPSVLLLDEPLSALDAKVRVQLRDEIRRIQTELLITTVYVTHDQEEALAVSDRVVVLSAGRVEQVGPPAEIYDSPQTLFVAEFIGTMNRVPGTVVSNRDGLVDCKGVPVAVEAARELTVGADVVVLIRPESIELRPVDGDQRPFGGLEGHVVAHSFLGPVTRLMVTSPVGNLVADIASTEALSVRVGSPVTLRWDSATLRLLPISVGGDYSERSDLRAGPADAVQSA